MILHINKKYVKGYVFVIYNYELQNDDGEVDGIEYLTLRLANNYLKRYPDFYGRVEIYDRLDEPIIESDGSKSHYDVDDDPVYIMEI